MNKSYVFRKASLAIGVALIMASAVSHAQNNTGIDVAATVSARQESAVSLQDALNLAISNSMRLEIAQARNDAADAGIDAARAAYMPKLGALAKTSDAINERYTGYQRTLDEYGQAQLSLQYTALDFGRRKSDMARARYERARTEDARSQEAEDVRFDTVRAFVDCDRYRKMLDISNDHISELTHFTSLMEDRVKAGLSPDSELIRSRLALNSARNRHKSLSQRLQQSEQALRSITGKRLQSRSINVDVRDVRHTLSAISQEATRSNYGLSSIRQQISSAEASVDRAKADRRPKIDVVGTYRQPFQSGVQGMGANVFVQVSMDLFDGGRKRAVISQASAAEREAQAQYELMRRDVENAATNLAVDATTAYDQWTLSKAGTSEAQRTKELYMDEFRLGTRSLSDLISAQNDYETQRLDNVDAAANYLLSVIGLYHVAGDTVRGLDTFQLLASSGAAYAEKDQ